MAEQKKDLVKEIFEKSKEAGGKVSTLFTHFKQPAKPHPAKKVKMPSFSKALPAAIDMGTSIIKLLQLSENSKGELKPSCQDRQPYSTDKKEALKKIVERNKGGPEAVASILAKDVQIYNLTFPQMSETELGDAIRWKVTQLRPFGLNIEEVVYSHIRWQNPGGPNSTQQRILLVCASRQVVQETVSLLQEVGLKAAAIEVAPISLVNLDKFQRLAPTRDEIVMRLDIGSKESAMVISRGDTLYFCRSLALTSEHMTKQIAQHCHVNEVVAEELKRQHGLSVWSPEKKVSAFLEERQASQKSEDKPAMVYHSLISLLENLVVDIEHSFKYFSYQVTQSQITKFDRLILSGGGSGLKNLERFLNTRLGVPVERSSPFSLAADFAVCAGLAAGQKIEEEKRINLVPREAKKGLGFLAGHLSEKPVRAAILVVGLALLLIVVQLTRSGLYGWRMNSYTKKVREAQAQLGRLQSSQLKLAEEEGRLLEKKARLTGRLNLLDEGVRRPEEFSKVLAEVASLLPDEIWASKLLYSEKKLNITGATSDMNLIMELVETLKSSDNFIEATFNYSQKDPKANIYNFEVLAEVKQ